MGQKVHPVGFRLGITKNHLSKWFAISPVYSRLVIEDYYIRNILSRKFVNGLISKVEIQRKFDDQIQLTLYSSKPGLLLSCYRNNLKVLSDELTLEIKKNRKENFQGNLKEKLNVKTFYSLKPRVTVQIFELSNPETNAESIAELLAEELQKRVAFRRAIKKTIRRTQRKKIMGVKIQISGRLNGAEIARSEWVREGRIPLQTLKADIDYCYRATKTIYGVLGIKVWVYR